MAEDFECQTKMMQLLESIVTVPFVCILCHHTILCGEKERE